MFVFSIFGKVAAQNKYTHFISRAGAAEFFFQKGEERVSIMRTLDQLHILTREREGARNHVLIKMVPRALGEHKPATGHVALEHGYNVPMIELQKAERELIANGNRSHRMAYDFVNRLRQRP